MKTLWRQSVFLRKTLCLRELYLDIAFLHILQSVTYVEGRKGKRQVVVDGRKQNAGKKRNCTCTYEG